MVQLEISLGVFLCMDFWLCVCVCVFSKGSYPLYIYIYMVV